MQDMQHVSFLASLVNLDDLRAHAPYSRHVPLPCVENESSALPLATLTISSRKLTNICLRKLVTALHFLWQAPSPMISMFLEMKSPSL